LTIHGTVAGDIAAAERVELTDTATVRGTLLSPAVIIKEGAVFNGAIAVDRHPDGALGEAGAGKARK
jgi:cytoskeletal protein CcmA (bactofilin family)